MSMTDAPLPDMRPALIVWGEHLAPSAITNLLGVAPTKSHLKGEKNKWGVEKEDGAWMLYGERKHFATVAECLDDFLCQFPSGIEHLANVPHARCRIEIDIGYSSEYPVIDLENRHVRLLAVTNGEFVTTICDLGRTESSL